MTQPDAFEPGENSPGPAAPEPPSHAGAAARKILIGFALVVVFGGGYYLLHSRTKGPLEFAYAGNRQVTIWSTTAQVREPVAIVNYGAPLDVLKRTDDDLEVRTTDLWLKAKDLEEGVAKMPVQAQGHTRVLTNLHILPGRDAARLRQLNRNVPVDLYLRKPLDVPVTTNPNDEEDSNEPPEAKKEDWWLVQAHTSDDDVVAGWVLGRFIDLDVPEPLPDYASSAGVHIVSWAVLNHVRDRDGTMHPQYLVLASQGPEGGPCDFTMLRGYTWGMKSQRYETAYVESDLCGMLPLHVDAAKQLGGDSTFWFRDVSDGDQQRTYHMHQTIIRRERKPGEPEHPGKRTR